jgi:hypothetical protein
MPRLNFNFTIGLDVTIITMLVSTKPKHFNTNILQYSFLVFSNTRSKIRNTTQKFLNFVTKSYLCIHALAIHL